MKTCRERLSQLLAGQLVADLEAISWRWSESHQLDTPEAIHCPELIAWIWGKLMLAGCPVLRQIVLLSELFPEASENRAALLELHRRIKAGESMFGTESPLLWEKAPPLSSLAEHCKMISNMEASIDLPTTVFSFCPWADEYPQAHSAIKACLTIKAWSAASQDI